MNVLITAAGIRGYLIKYFREACGDSGKIFAADCSGYSPALYDAEGYFLIPEAGDTNYVNELIKLCEANDIDGVVSLSDIELPILAKHKSRFSEKGIQVIISDPEVIDICYDKYKTFLFLKEKGFSAPKTFVSPEEAIAEIEKGGLEFPVLVKPRKGSASIGIKTVSSVPELHNEFGNRNDAIIQEFILGDEYGIDVFGNSDLRPVAVFAKKKIKMRAGETDKAISIYDEKMMQIASDLANRLGLYGPADIDAFKRDDEYIIMEINPRFGGGYPLSHAIGADFPSKVISLIKREKLEPNYTVYPDNILMMKQYEIVIKKLED